MVEISVILILIIIFTCDIFIFYCMYVFFIIMFYCVYGQMSEIKNYYYYYKVTMVILSICMHEHEKYFLIWYSVNIIIR